MIEQIIISNYAYFSRWDIPTGRGREGSRIYQLVLRKVQIHPSNSLSSSVVCPLGKGKKRAVDIDLGDDSLDDAAAPPSPTKKSKSSTRTGADKDVTMSM